MSNELLNAYLAWYSLSLSPTIYFILVVSEKLHMIGLALAHYHHAAAAIISKKIPSFFTNRERKGIEIWGKEGGRRDKGGRRMA